MYKGDSLWLNTLPILAKIQSPEWDYAFLFLSFILILHIVMPIQRLFSEFIHCKALAAEVGEEFSITTEIGWDI